MAMMLPWRLSARCSSRLPCMWRTGQKLPAFSTSNKNTASFICEAIRSSVDSWRGQGWAIPYPFRIDLPTSASFPNRFTAFPGNHCYLHWRQRRCRYSRGPAHNKVPSATQIAKPLTSAQMMSPPATHNIQCSFVTATIVFCLTEARTTDVED